MQKIKASLAMFAALSLGAILSTGCQPPTPPMKAGPAPAARPSSLTTDAEKGRPMKKGEAKPEEAKPEETKQSGDAKPDETKSEAKPGEAKPEEAKTEDAKPEAKPEAKKPEEKPTEDKPAEEKKPQGDQVAAADARPVPAPKSSEWNQWGGSSIRNNAPNSKAVFTQFAPGKFDRKTGAWLKDKAKDINWVSSLGSQTYGNTVVAQGKVFLGTNNSFGYLKRYPGADVDLGCLVCFDEKNGKFLWQHSSEKLPTGRVHDWPMQGICCSPLVEGDRLWFVTSRGEVRCLDTQGFYDGEDDGPVKNDPAKMFEMMKGEDPAEDKVQAIVAALDSGKLTDEVLTRLEKAGAKITGEVAVAKDETAKAPAKKWKFQAEVDGKKRDFFITLGGPRLAVFKVITPDDKEEADVVWVFDMMKTLGTSQHNMCSCSVTSFGDILLVNTSNGVDEAHITVPAPDAPSFVAMDKNTGKVFWTDNSPRGNILHGQWSSPTVAVIADVPQVIFGGGDGWMYSFKCDKGKDGKPELLWKFDANPKNTILELAGRGTRNDIISTPVVYDNKVYFATGQDPEHGEGSGILWCIDPTKRGDISEELAVNRADPKTPIPVKRVQAVVEADGDKAIPNPSSGVVWKYTEYDNDGDGKIDDFLEKFHRSIGTVAIKNDLLFISDFSGLFHCVDAKTGKVHWTYDMLAAAWGSALIVGNHVYIGDEDGDIAIFDLKAEKHDPVAEVNMGSSVYSTPIVANNTLFIATKEHVFAISPDKGGEAAAAASGGGK